MQFTVCHKGETKFFSEQVIKYFSNCDQLHSQAFNYKGIPIPVVKNMARGICKGLDFLHRKCNIIHTDLKPENVLLHFNSSFNDETDVSVVSEGSHSQSNSTSIKTNIDELERALENPNLSRDERKQIRNRLKNKRRKEKKKEKLLNDSSNGDLKLFDDSGLLTDSIALSIIENLKSTDEEKLTPSSKEIILSRLSHSPFVSQNFSAVQIQSSKWDEVIISKAELSNLSRQKSQFLDDSSNLVEITFFLRAFGPEGEVADNVSSAIGIKWEKSIAENESREW